MPCPPRSSLQSASFNGRGILAPLAKSLGAESSKIEQGLMGGCAGARVQGGFQDDSHASRARRVAGQSKKGFRSRSYVGNIICVFTGKKRFCLGCNRRALVQNGRTPHVGANHLGGGGGRY